MNYLLTNLFTFYMLTEAGYLQLNRFQVIHRGALLATIVLITFITWHRYAFLHLVFDHFNILAIKYINKSELVTSRLTQYNM